jgi:hypothetical protein
LCYRWRIAETLPLAANMVTRNLAGSIEIIRNDSLIILSTTSSDAACAAATPGHDLYQMPGLTVKQYRDLAGPYHRCGG